MQILHKHEKQRKNTRKHTHAQQSRKRAKISEKMAEKRKNATTASGANDEQIRTNGKTPTLSYYYIYI